jgi:hypothetical protein
MSLLAQAGETIVLAAALLSLAAAARAQSRSGATPISVWRLGLNADAMWYENGEFVGATDQTWSTGGRASLDWSRRFQRGTFDLGAYGGTIYYPDIESFHQAVYGAHLGLDTKPSTRTQFTLGQTFARTNTRQLPYDTGDVPLPTTGIYTASTNAGLTHRTSEWWEMSVTGAFEMRRYDQGAFVDGETADAGLSMGRLLGPSGAVTMSYEFASSWYDDTTFRAHQLLFGGRRKPKRGLQVDVSAGAAYVEPQGTVYPAGQARLSASGRYTGFSLAYQRQFAQAFGYGRATVGDLGTASLSWKPARNVSFTAGYSYGYRRDRGRERRDVEGPRLLGPLQLGEQRHVGAEQGRGRTRDGFSFLRSRAEVAGSGPSLRHRAARRTWRSRRS